jgi:hypothetical protein
MLTQGEQFSEKISLCEANLRLNHIFALSDLKHKFAVTARLCFISQM